FPSFKHRDEIVAMIKYDFPAERRRIIHRADRAVCGEFDLLGYKRISFGNPIDWHLDPTTGKRTSLDHWSRIDYLDPEVAGDKKVTWELNRHRHFVTLGQAYWLTGDERYTDAFVSQAASWMDANPPSRGINWASSLEVAFRSIAWLWAWHLFAPSERIETAFVTRMLKHLIAHGRHIERYLSHYFSPNTHLTGEALGLFYLGLCLPELARARRWRETGLRILLEQLGVQVRADGVYFERASYYHRYTADFYTHLFVLAEANGLSLPAEIKEKLSLLLDYLMWITKPDGSSPLIGDDDGGRLLALGDREADDFRDTLATGAQLFERGDWKFVAGDAAIETLWLMGPAAIKAYDRIEARPLLARSRAFAESGYYVMRDGWSKDSSYVVISCCPQSAAPRGHAHSDALAIELAALGKSWLVDPGTYTYTADAESRNEFRHSRAHNTVTVDGESQSVPAGPFSWENTASAKAIEFVSRERLDYFAGSHDGYERLADPVKHTREVIFLKSGPDDCGSGSHSRLIVRDIFSAQGRHSYALTYHLSPGCVASVNGPAEVQVTEPGGDQLSIYISGQPSLSPRIIEGRVSRCYGECETAPVVVFEAEGEGPQEFITLIIPTAKKVVG
ncbi:MAG TPA: alginate lyase family protein, partial [Blastocatellia bacterium]|nr:alginate lyase family protein [Blastocatellia bacterium]